MLCCPICWGSAPPVGKKITALSAEVVRNRTKSALRADTPARPKRGGGGAHRTNPEISPPLLGLPFLLTGTHDHEGALEVVSRGRGATTRPFVEIYKDRAVAGGGGVGDLSLEFHGPP